MIYIRRSVDLIHGRARSTLDRKAAQVFRAVHEHRGSQSKGDQAGPVVAEVRRGLDRCRSVGSGRRHEEDDLEGSQAFLRGQLGCSIVGQATTRSHEKSDARDRGVHRGDRVCDTANGARAHEHHAHQDMFGTAISRGALVRDDPGRVKEPRHETVEKKEWCNVPLTPEAIARMNDLLDLYARPYDPLEPVICIDEKTKQLVEDINPSLSATPGHEMQIDYHYRRKGTGNIFLSVEPKGGVRVTRVTKRKTSVDFAPFFVYAVDQYPEATKVHVVMDNYKTHLAGALKKILGENHPVFLKVVFHYTPTRGSWLNQAEIEIGIMGAQCLNRRIGSLEILELEVPAWTNDRNDARAMISWKFTKEDAKRVFKLE